MPPEDTIAAIATAPGMGGIGVVRVTGPGVAGVARRVIGGLPAPRRATLRTFFDSASETIDLGIALFFPGPSSFTGEDVLELQGHGSPVVLQALLASVLSAGARLARPGEFTERAFLNGKIDLTQAEAIADLIESATTRAARMAMRTLQGELGRRVSQLVERLIQLRTHVEAILDFPDEEVEGIDWDAIEKTRGEILAAAAQLVEQAERGRMHRDGLRCVIAGPPNAGKSSLMNALAGREMAIVTPLPGTTRDVLREHIQIEGLPLRIADTAGIRDAADAIEAEGIRRARGEMERADRILWVYDGRDGIGDAVAALSDEVAVTWVRNKIDLLGEEPHARETDWGPEISLSALTGRGVDLLLRHLRGIAGIEADVESEFIARQRHIEALEGAIEHLRRAACPTGPGDIELVAEHLRAAQQYLGEITGVFSTEDLLERIFSSFCIGK